MPGVTIAGITDPRVMLGVYPLSPLLRWATRQTRWHKHLAEHDVYVWSGDYYALEIMRALERPEGMVRVGIGQYNTYEEITTLLDLVDGL